MVEAAIEGTLPPPRRRGRPPQLDRETIVRAAERVDADALTMPGLARDLGVPTSTLYTYFPNKKALLEALSVSALNGIELPSTDSIGWREWLRAVADALRDIWTDNPPLFDHDEAAMRSAAVRLLDDTIQVMHRHGFRTEDAMRANELIIMVGYLGSISRRRWRNWGPITQRQARDLLSDTASELWQMPEIVNFYATFDLDKHHRAQLETVLDGIAARLCAAGDDSAAPRT